MCERFANHDLQMFRMFAHVPASGRLARWRGASRRRGDPHGKRRRRLRADRFRSSNHTRRSRLAAAARGRRARRVRLYRSSAGQLPAHGALEGSRGLRDRGPGRERRFGDDRTADNRRPRGRERLPAAGKGLGYGRDAQSDDARPDALPGIVAADAPTTSRGSARRQRRGAHQRRSRRHQLLRRRRCGPSRTQPRGRQRDRPQRHRIHGCRGGRVSGAIRRALCGRNQRQYAHRERIGRRFGIRASRIVRRLHVVRERTRSRGKRATLAGAGGVAGRSLPRPSQFHRRPRRRFADERVPALRGSLR